MTTRATEEELLGRARRGLAQRDAAGFKCWFEAARPALRAAARQIYRRWGIISPGSAALDEVVQVAAIAAWRAIAGYKFICPACLGASARFGAVRNWGAETEEQLAEHMAAQHPGRAVRPHVTLHRRVWYLAGVAMQSAVRADHGHRRRTKLVLPDQLPAPSIAELRDMEQQTWAQLNCRLVYGKLPPRRRALAQALYAGLDAKAALALCSLTLKEVRA